MNINASIVFKSELRRQNNKIHEGFEARVIRNRDLVQRSMQYLFLRNKPKFVSIIRGDQKQSFRERNNTSVRRNQYRICISKARYLKNQATMIAIDAFSVSRDATARRANFSKRGSFRGTISSTSERSLRRHTLG